jgi:hypothetical protein
VKAFAEGSDDRRVSHLKFDDFGEDHRSNAWTRGGIAAT